MTAVPPVFIFSAPYCGISRLTAMLGLHPELCVLPELNLFIGDTVGELLEIAEFGHGLTLDGLLRAVAELAFGGQNDAQVACARDWLDQHADQTVNDLLRQLMEWAQPKRLIVADSQAPLRPIDLMRWRRDAAGGRCVHLTRHPYTQGLLFARSLKERLFVPPDYKDHSCHPAETDPQIPWLRANHNILRAVAMQHAEVRGDENAYILTTAEALVSEPDAALAPICRWLGIDASSAAMRSLNDYRSWRFWHHGPPGAPLGLEAEAYEMEEAGYLRAAATPPLLDAPLPWKHARTRFAAEVVELAGTFGYR